MQEGRRDSVLDIGESLFQPCVDMECRRSWRYHDRAGEG